MRHGVVVARYGLIQICFQVFDLCLKHHVMGFAVLFLELVEFAFFPVVFLSNVLEMILNAEILPFFLFEFASVVVNFPLKSLKLGFGGIHRDDRLTD